MPASKKKSPRSRRQDIAALALELFLAKGFAATSMRAVAEAAGITKASLYHHFASKEDLFIVAATGDHEASVAELFDIAQDADLTHIDRLGAALRVIYRGMVLSDTGRMSTVIAETSRRFPKVAEEFYERFILRMEQGFDPIYLNGRADGVFADLPLPALHKMVFAPPVSLALSREMFGSVPAACDKVDFDQTFGDHLNMLLRLMLEDRGQV